MQNNYEGFSVHKLYQRNIERTTDTNRKNSVTAITMAATKTLWFSIANQALRESSLLLQMGIPVTS